MGIGSRARRCGLRGALPAGFVALITLLAAGQHQVHAACALGTCIDGTLNRTPSNSGAGGGSYYNPAPPPSPAPTLTPEQREAQEVEGLLDSAEALIRMGKFDTALSEVNEVLAIRPSDPDAIALRQRIMLALNGPAPSAPAPMPSPVLDAALPTSVVDARGQTVDLRLPIPALIEASSALGEWRKGMDAVRQRDWKVAAAWFKQGLLKDPGNDALRRAADLADWTIKFRDQEQSGRGAMSLIDRAFDARDSGDRATYENTLAQIRNHPNYADPQAQRWRDLVFQRLEERSLAGGPKPYAQMTPDERLALTTERLMGEAMAEDLERMGTSALLDNRPADARTALRASATVAPHIPYYKRYADALDAAR